MNSPDFLIIGAQKCGTSWLHRQLRQHPGIFMPSDKDAPFFFNNENETQAFLRRFDSAPANSLVGDACASYFWTRNTGPYPSEFNKDISLAIRQHLGNRLKVIVLLKDPVQRSISGYLHHIAHGSLDSSCGILDAPKELGIISLSRFESHLRHWQEDFSARQLLIVPAPDAGNSASILKSATKFLGLDSNFRVINPDEVVFSGMKRRSLNDEIWVATADLAIPGDGKAVRTSIDSVEHTRLIDKDEIQALGSILAPDVAIFRELFSAETDYSHWIR